MAIKPQQARYVIQDIKAIEDAHADMRLSGLTVPDELMKLLYQAIQDKNKTTDDLIAEYDNYVRASERNK